MGTPPLCRITVRVGRGSRRPLTNRPHELTPPAPARRLGFNSGLGLAQALRGRSPDHDADVGLGAAWPVWVRGGRGRGASDVRKGRLVAVSWRATASLSSRLA